MTDNMQRIYLQILAAIAIVVLCILISLHIIGLINIALFNNLIVKSVTTAIACTGFIIYLILQYKKHHNRQYLIAYSLIFEAIGYWWLFSWIGYIFIVVGLILLIFGFFPQQKDEPR